MAAGDTTRLVIELEVLLRNLNRTLRGLDSIEQRLRRVANIRVGAANASATDRQTSASQRLANQQQRLSIQSQELANRQERARQAADRLVLSQQRLANAQQRVARTTGQQADAHVRAFRAIQRSLAQAPQLDAHVRAFRALNQTFSRAPQLDAHVRAFRAMEAFLSRSPQMDAHVRAFRALQRATAQAPQLDAHVRAFRRLQEAAQQLNRQIAALGNSLRSVGQGLASFGATLSISVSAPLAALGVGVVDAAVRMDSLRRGLTTIAGSSELAAVQLERLTEIAKLPGIGFEEAIQGSIALQAVGFSAAEAEKALVQFSNAVALTGGSREQLQAVTVQLGQMAAQSKVLAADLKPIINAAPAVAVALRNAFGTVRSEEIQELGIQSKDFIDIMVRELARLPRAAAGARNSFDNFRDSVFRAAATIGESLLPALVKLADAFGPILSGIANAFAALPAPIQSTVLVIGALTIALGPVTFIFGQLITGLGRVVVGFAQLNALGLLPTIANFRLLGRVMIGTASLAQGAAATAAAAAVGWAALGAAVIAAVGIVAAIVTLSTRTKEHVETTEEQIRATEASLKVLRAQREVLDKVTAETEAVASASDELKTIYKSLNRESQGRVTLLQREVGLTRALKDEIGRLITVREGEQRIQAATTATLVTQTAQQITTLGQQIDSTINRVERLRQARESLVRTGRLPRGIQDPLLSSIASLDTAKQIEQIDRTLQRLTTETLVDLRKQSDDATEALAKQSDQLQRLEQATGRSTREILEQAKAYGLFKGDVDIAAQGIEAFRKAQISLEAALSGTTEEVIRQRLEMRKLSEPAQRAQDDRRRQIEAAIDFARENANTIDEAKKKLDEFAEKFPEVRKAIEDEKRKGPIEEFLREFTGRKKAGRADTGTSLRNAQQQLADALIQIALASSEREVEIERDRNAALLQAAEVGQRLRLISYREYLELRANLTAANLDKEIGQQLEIVKNAKLVQARLLREATRAGIPEAERTRRRAQAAQAEEEAIRAETRLIILRRERARIDSELTQAIKESQDQQLKDTRQLEIQYAELQGRIQAALDATAVEEFREQLEELGKAQDFLNKQIEKARAGRKGELVEDLQRARDLNQRQIEAINNITRQRFALSELAAAEKLIENAKERQQRLEQDLRFQVEFRGLSEEEAIRRRLEGEQKLQASMELAKSLIEQTRQAFVDLGLTPPPELGKFIENLRTELLGLGELSFTEQFRLAEKEFQRLNDERLRRIADVERAVNNRTIAEAEGLLLIRRINGEYVGDLEQQLALLKEIAAASNDANLQRQAQSAEETVKDAGDKLADFNKQLRSTAIDSLRSGFINLFQNLRDNTISAKERLLDLIDSVVNRINEVIAERLFDKFIESLTAGGKDGGILGKIGEFLGFGDGKAVGTTVANTTATQANTAAINALTTAFGGQAAGGIGGVIAAGAGGGGDAGKQGGGFLRKVASVLLGGIPGTSGVGVGTGATGDTVISALSSNTESLKQLTQSVNVLIKVMGGVAPTAATGISDFLSSFLSGGAATGLFPAVPGGVYRVVEGGFPEAVLTTDPKHAARQVAILRAFLRETRGLGGRIRGLAAGGFAMPDLSLNVPSVSLPSGNFSDMEISRSQPINLRNINLFDRREMVRGYMRSAEGTQDLLNLVSEQADEIGRRIKVR